MSGLTSLLFQIGRHSAGLSSDQTLADSDFPPGTKLVRLDGDIDGAAVVKAAPDMAVIEHIDQPEATLETVHRLRALCNYLPIVLVAWGSNEQFVIDAFHAGVTRFVKLPCNRSELEKVFKEIAGDVESGKNGKNSDMGQSCLIGNSAPMCELRRYIHQIAPFESNVLITGETGTGKELVAQLIRQNSARKDRPFICLNSAAIPDALVESELFGYERGAFTGAMSAQDGKLAAANHGTVFFDEIGDVSPAVQAKLLRAIESKKIYRLGSNRCSDLDIRIIAASNQDLEAATLQNRFRGDLYYRLNVIRIEVPPLRDRLEDLPELVEHYVRYFRRTFGKRVVGFNSEAMDLLFSYSWPGNIRELKNVLEAAFVSLPDQSNGMLGLPSPIARRLSVSVSSNPTERIMLLEALTAANWNRTEAAKRLQWSRMTLYRKMIRYHVEPTRAKL